MTLTEQFCCHSTNGTFSQQEIFFVALIIASAAAAIEDLNQEVKWDPAGRVKKNFKTFPALTYVKIFFDFYVFCKFIIIIIKY